MKTFAGTIILHWVLEIFFGLLHIIEWRLLKKSTFSVLVKAVESTILTGTDPFLYLYEFYFAMFKEKKKNTSLYQKIKIKKTITVILKKNLTKVKVNVSKKNCKLQTTYGRDKTKQAEMPDFSRGPSR